MADGCYRGYKVRSPSPIPNRLMQKGRLTPSFLSVIFASLTQTAQKSDQIPLFIPNPLHIIALIAGIYTDENFFSVALHFS